MDEKINCENGLYRWGGHNYHDHTHFGFLTSSQIVAFSSDIGSMKIAEKLGKEGVTQAMSDFGFGYGGTSSYFPGAAPGHYPTDFNVDSHSQILPNFSIGRGIYSSPLELVQAYGAIANHGNLLKPKELGNEIANASVVKKVISPQTADEMRGMLEKAVTEGWSKQVFRKHKASMGGLFVLCQKCYRCRRHYSLSVKGFDSLLRCQRKDHQMPP